MLFTPIYIAMTFIKTWRIRSFRVRLLEFLSGNTSVAFCKVPENAAETPSLSSKLCTNPKNAYLCELLDYTNTTRICSMKPNQCIELYDWISCSGGMPLGGSNQDSVGKLDLEILLECEMEQSSGSDNNITPLDTMGHPVAWKAGTHLAIVLKTNIEHLSILGLNFVGGEFTIDHKLPVVRIQTIQLSGEPNMATDASMRSLRSEIQHSLKNQPKEFQWPVHAALLRKLSKVVDIKSDSRCITTAMNGSSDLLEPPVVKKAVSLADVSVNTTKSLTEENGDPDCVDTLEPVKVTMELSTERKLFGEPPDNKNSVLSKENFTVEIEHTLTPKKSSLKLDLKKSTSQLSASLMNISSQIKSVTTHKRVVSSTGPRKSHPQIDACVKVHEEPVKANNQKGTPKSVKSSRPLVNTKSPNVLIYSDSIIARDNLEASLRKVLDCDRYTIYSVTRDNLESGSWRGRAALVAIAGEVSNRGASLLLAHLLDGGRLLALCSDLLHTVLPYYKTAEVRENELVQFTYDKWKSVKMKHHIFCYQASPAKKQFSTETDRQPSKYAGHPGHELDIQVLASEETWRTPSLLQATDSTNNGVAIFSQIHLEADPSDYLGDEGIKSNEARLQIIHKVLGDVLGLHVRETSEITNIQYSRGYFLGNHVNKMSLVDALCPDASCRIQKLGDLTVQWCLRGETPRESPSANFLPIFVHECPEHFSTVEYFDNLTSSHIGRLVIYADVVSSTQDICSNRLGHGVSVVGRRQLSGRGRGGNAWLSAEGCAMISTQMWLKMSNSVSLVQHCAALAAVRAVRSLPAYEQLDIRIKWPNDIYYGRDIKIGGVVTTANCEGEDIYINIGTGMNISNSVPTTCVNDIIKHHNKIHNTKLQYISVEKFLARYCSQLERIIQYIDSDGGIDAFLEQYYTYWLHDSEEVRVIREGDCVPVTGTVCGLDEGGWLRVRTVDGELRVTPDGNTFDMMAGLIAPKQ